MKTSTIAEAKNNLSQLIHQLESDEAIHLTRHGKPVAVMLSEANYQKLTQKNKGLFQAIQQWRSQLDEDSALTEAELKQLRAAGQGQEFSWDE
jgi:prevent-host-death family protein